MSLGAPDTRLSNYRLERLLGSGGMGSVYLARDLALDRDVAIKFIAADKAADASARHRLIREAKAAAALDHPNICGVHEVIVEPDGRAAIVMQYVEGETLAETLRRGPLEVRFALAIATDLANALVAAYKRGIIHRDIKPQNIIITPEKQAKLLDFGVARQHEVTTDGADTTALLTTPGIIVGTPAYMSPEQAQQLAIDGRSDLFSLGAVLYECLTGKRPFTGRSSIDVLGAVLHHDPPAVSSFRPELTGQHDELVGRLLAKHPDDRFKSADELLGALRLLAGTSRVTKREGWPQPTPARKKQLILVGAGVAILLVVVAVFAWRRPPSESSPSNPQAADWYRRGIEFIRAGAPHSARLALNEAIRAAPEFVPAYVRLAEAETELDEAGNAQQALLKVASLVSNESGLPVEDRKRVQAVSALMVHDLDTAVRAYREIAERRPNDAGVLLDLGRVQDASGFGSDARETYGKALQINPQYAAAHLRRGAILGLEARPDEALKAFDEAERLYRAAANVEGEIETLIRRGMVLNSAGDLRGARAALEQARDLSKNLRSKAQGIRAQLQLSSVTASEGQWAQAEKMADAAVNSALAEGLQTVAADGLIDLAQVLIHRGRTSEADAHLAKAIELADKRGARRVVERAKLQRAALMAQTERPEEAIAAAKGPLEFFQANRYRRNELTGLSIIARAYEGLGRFPEARAMAEQGLRTATDAKDEIQMGEALETLAGVATATGALPDALDHRTRGLAIHRKLKYLGALPFDLVNRAELLIRLGRHAEAAELLNEIDAGVASKQDAFLPRARRARAFRAMSAAIQHRAHDIQVQARQVPPAAGGKPDFNSQLAAVLLEYAASLGGAAGKVPPSKGPVSGSLSSVTGRELRYWDLALRLVRNDAEGALRGAQETLDDPGASVSYEAEWRIAAIGAAAARQLKNVEQEPRFRDRAQRALDRLRKEWKSDVASYEARPDLVELRRKAGLN